MVSAFFPASQGLKVFVPSTKPGTGTLLRELPRSRNCSWIVSTFIWNLFRGHRKWRLSTSDRTKSFCLHLYILFGVKYGTLLWEQSRFKNFFLKIYFLEKKSDSYDCLFSFISWSLLYMNTIMSMRVKLYFLSLPHFPFFSSLDFYLLGLSNLSPVSINIIITISSTFLIHKYTWWQRLWATFCLRYETSLLILLFFDSYTVFGSL